MNSRWTSEAVPGPGATERDTPPPGHGRADIVVLRLPRLWMSLSLATALIAAAGSVAGLLAPDRIYGQETATLADAAAAQDTVNLAVVVPLIVVLAIWASRGSARAYVCWLGCLAFTAYNDAIYAFSIHFGPLFCPGSPFSASPSTRSSGAWRAWTPQRSRTGSPAEPCC